MADDTEVRGQTNEGGGTTATADMEVYISCPEEAGAGAPKIVTTQKQGHVTVKFRYNYSTDDCYCTGSKSTTDKRMKDFVKNLKARLTKDKDATANQALSTETLKSMYYAEILPNYESEGLRRGKLLNSREDSEAFREIEENLLNKFYLDVQKTYFDVNLPSSLNEQDGPMGKNIACIEGNDMRRFMNQLQPVLRWILAYGS